MYNNYNVSNQNLDIYDFCDEIQKACKKNGWDFDERFGFVYINTKFESWCFELTNGKIKLLHKNTIYNSNSDYHVQWRKFVTPKYLVTYINSHGKKKYQCSKTLKVV